MTSSSAGTVHLAVYDTFADWETGHTTAHLTQNGYTVRTVGLTREPVTTMGGLRVRPDLAVDELRSQDSALLILTGAAAWDTGDALAPFARAARGFLDAGTPVAAICGATAGLAREGLLDDRAHTSAVSFYLAATGYAGGERYVEADAVTDPGRTGAGAWSRPGRRSRWRSRARCSRCSGCTTRRSWTRGTGCSTTRTRARTRCCRVSEAARESEAARANGIPSAQELLSRAAVTAFRLNGQFLSVADELARRPGSRRRGGRCWRGAGGAAAVAGIARSMGITRQSVQRIADLLVERGLAEYTENPAHRRAKLLRVTDAGRRAVARIGPPHAEFAARLAGELGVEGLSDAVGALERLSEALDTLTGADRGGSGPSGAQGVSGVQGVSGGS